MMQNDNIELQEKIDELLLELNNDISLKDKIKHIPTKRVIDVLIDTKNIEKTLTTAGINKNSLKSHVFKALNMIRLDKNFNLKLGNLALELFEAMNKEPEWEKYVSVKTAKVIKVFYEIQNMNETCRVLGHMKYTTVRSHIIRALNRITEKKTDFKHGGKSEQAQELFDLMDNVTEWPKFVTNQEYELATKFRQVRSFYELGRQLNLKPGNIAGTLYGTTQRIGVIGKIKLKINQTDRRDIDGRREEA